MSYTDPRPQSTKTICPHCGKRIARKGLEDHLKNHAAAQQAVASAV
jgi:hypothetical protein